MLSLPTKGHETPAPTTRTGTAKDLGEVVANMFTAALQMGMEMSAARAGIVSNNTAGDRAGRGPSGSTVLFEQHYTPKQLAQSWGFDETTIRRMFQDDPRVLKYGKSNRRDGKRDYMSIKVPQSVAAEKYRELKESGGMKGRVCK